MRTASLWPATTARRRVLPPAGLRARCWRIDDRFLSAIGLRWDGTTRLPENDSESRLSSDPEPAVRLPAGLFLARRRGTVCRLGGLQGQPALEFRKRLRLQAIARQGADQRQQVVGGARFFQFDFEF